MEETTSRSNSLLTARLPWGFRECQMETQRNLTRMWLFLGKCKLHKGKKSVFKLTNEPTEKGVNKDEKWRDEKENGLSSGTY